jgi:hypothetical protein
MVRDSMKRRAMWLALAVAPACLFPDVGNLGGEADAGVDAEAGAMDARQQDTSPMPDASVDAGPWCAAHDAGYLFCADFDESNMAVQAFDLEGQVGQGGMFSVTTSTFVSAPQSALGVANPFDAGQTSGDRLIKSLWSLGTTPASITCSTQWDPVALSTTPNDYAHVIAFELYSDAMGTQQIAYFGLNMLPSGALELLEIHGNTATPHAVVSSVATGSWVPVTMTLSPGQQYSVTVGTQNATGTLASPVPSPSHGTLEVGPAYFAANTPSSSPGWTFGYDNVICY